MVEPVIKEGERERERELVNLCKYIYLYVDKERIKHVRQTEYYLNKKIWMNNIIDKKKFANISSSFTGKKSNDQEMKKHYNSM